MYTLTILQFYVSCKIVKAELQREPCSAWPHCIARFLGHAPGEEEEAGVGVAEEISFQSPKQRAEQ